MTNHAVLAGSVLAGVALWVGVYAALLPRRGPDTPETHSVRATATAMPADDDPPSPGPRRWADLPRATATYPPPSPLDTDGPVASRLPDAGAPMDDRPQRRHRYRPIRPVALPDVLFAPHPTRQRAYPHARGIARTRLRRFKEPIQFSLATRSSS